MKQYTNPFEVICESKCDASVMQFKSHLIVMLMNRLGEMATKRKDMALILGCSTGEMSRIANGYLSSVSVEKLLKHLSMVDILLASSLISDGGDLRISAEIEK